MKQTKLSIWETWDKEKYHIMTALLIIIIALFTIHSYVSKTEKRLQNLENESQSGVYEKCLEWKTIPITRTIYEEKSIFKPKQPYISEMTIRYEDIICTKKVSCEKKIIYENIVSNDCGLDFAYNKSEFSNISVSCNKSISKEVEICDPPIEERR